MRKPKVITETKIEYRTDTLKQWYPVTKYVTIKDYEFIEVPKDSIIYTYKRDTVAIPVPIEERTYTDDSTYFCKISGYHPSLDYIETYNRQTTITNTIVKKPVLSIGPSVNAGFNPVTGKLDWSIGVSVMFPLYSIYTR